MANLALGIDTGGTYTDGVIFDTDKNEIIKKTKNLTTRHNLAIAIGNCLNNLITPANEQQMVNDIKMVSLSTTLATNAIVEGQGAEVGLIIIGFEPESELPTPYYSCIKGGCDIKGEIKEELNIREAEKVIKEMKDDVDAFAISGYLSIRNPEQEIKITRLVREITGYPVVSAHQLSSELGIFERTVTAVFNARLLPLITELIETVKMKLIDKNIDAPLMVVRGDGSLISEQVAREKPVETSLSGPAASIMGAMALTGLEQGIVVDMGGTTTDVAILQDGRPNLSKKGARVGGWLTRVKAADITTEGIGGDSLIQVSKEGMLSIGPQRVFPLSWAVAEYDNLAEELKEIKDAKYFPLNSQPVSILVFIKEPVNFKPSDTEKQILQQIREQPHSLYHLGQILDKETEILPWRHLVNVGCVHRAGLTPTDLLHYRGEYTDWSTEAARLGVEIMAERFKASPREFVDRVLDNIYYKIAVLLIRVLVNDEGHELNLEGKTVNYLIDKLLADDQDSLFVLNSKLNIPVLAVGAPVNSYFSRIAEKINAELHLPRSAEVANAVGTVSGKVIEKVNITIKPGKGGGFIVHSPRLRESFQEKGRALEFGRKEGRKYARQLAENSGARNIEIFVDKEDKYSRLPGQIEDIDENEQIFIESNLTITAVGKPW